MPALSSATIISLMFVEVVIVVEYLVLSPEIIIMHCLLLRFPQSNSRYLYSFHSVMISPVVLRSVICLILVFVIVLIIIELLILPPGLVCRVYPPHLKEDYGRLPLPALFCPAHTGT